MAAAKIDPMIQLYTAVNKVMLSVGFVNKGGTVQGGAGYKFVGEADLINAVRPHMVEHGLMLFPTNYEISENLHAKITDRYGKEKDQHLITVIGTFTLCHIGGGTTEIKAVGVGSDRQDKHANCAMTIALKYAMRQMFTLETGDDPDRHASGATDGEIAKAAEDQARTKAVAGAGSTIEQVNLYLTSKGQQSALTMPGPRFGEMLKFLKSANGKEKLAKFLEGSTTNSTDRASQAMDG